MESTKLISYRRWRNSLLKKGFSTMGPSRDESFGRMTRLSGTTLVESEETYPSEERLNMLQFQNHRYDKNVRQLVKNLAEIYYKEKVFRHERVAELKRRIQSGEYHISGAAVVEKWFQDEKEP